MLNSGEASCGPRSPFEESDGSSSGSDSSTTKNLFNSFSICALAITTVVGGQYYEWNTYLADGFGFFATAQLVMALAYIIYVFTMAEIVSAFPFSGGGFGLARVAQGYYIGFLVGCCEALEYIAYSALSFLYLSEQICLLLDIDKYYAFIISFFLYVIAGAITIHKGQLYLHLNYILAAVSVLILLMYCFGTLKWDNFLKNASLHHHKDNANTHNWFDGDMKAFLMALPSATVAYGGIEGMCLLPTLTSEPKKNIPRGMIAGVLILLACNVLVIFVMASQPGGIEATSKMDYPMTVGFSLMFKMPAVYGKLLMLPAQFAEGFGFILCFGKLLQSLGTINILPSFLMLKDCTDHTNGVIVGSTIGFIICVIYRVAGHDLLDICIFAGFLAYFSQLHGYYMLKTQYSTAVREFHSPFGLWGVAYCVVVFLLGAVAVFVSEPDHATYIIVGTILGVLSIYYFLFGAKHQTMAQEEMAVLFQLHVAKFNKRKKVKPSKKIATRPHMIVPIIRRLSFDQSVDVESRTDDVTSQVESCMAPVRAAEYCVVGEGGVTAVMEEEQEEVAEEVAEEPVMESKSDECLPEVNKDRVLASDYIDNLIVSSASVDEV